MKTIIINKPSNLTKYKDDYGIHIEGNCEINCSLGLQDLPKRLLVDGYLYIKADEYIEVGEYIKAGGDIKAGGYIKAGRYIEAGGDIKAGGDIEAGGSIEAGGDIKTGGDYGISAGLSINCKGEISFGLKIFAGICNWKKTSDKEKTITCSKISGGGVVEYGILKEILEEYTITIEGKEIKLSKESYDELKKSLS